jgi:hypothetical protein
MIFLSVAFLFILYFVFLCGVIILQHQWCMSLPVGSLIVLTDPIQTIANLRGEIAVGE